LDVERENLAAQIAQLFRNTKEFAEMNDLKLVALNIAIIFFVNIEQHLSHKV